MERNLINRLQIKATMSNNEELKVGTILIATGECIMNEISGEAAGKPSLVIGKEYPVAYITHKHLEVCSEVGQHIFYLKGTEAWDKFFKIKPLNSEEKITVNQTNYQ